MLGVIGDIVQDVVVWQLEKIRPATDTKAEITVTRGGSAANVAAFAAPRHPTRFIGCVGDDLGGLMLTQELTQRGVDVRLQTRGGTLPAPPSHPWRPQQARTGLPPLRSLTGAMTPGSPSRPNSVRSAAARDLLGDVHEAVGTTLGIHHQVTDHRVVARLGEDHLHEAALGGQ